VRDAAGRIEVQERIMFVLKKLLSAAVQPCSLLLAVMTLGLVLLLFTKRQRTARALLTAGLALLALLSLGPVARALVRPLEIAYPRCWPRRLKRFQPCPTARPRRVGSGAGGGKSDDDSLAPVQKLAEPSLVRLAEGIRLQRLLSGSQLLLSGGSSGTTTSEAETLAAAGVSLGAPRDHMVLESQSWDTIDEVRMLRAMLGDDRFVLVTSPCTCPGHGYVQEGGMIPVAAPPTTWPAARIQTC